MKKLLYIGLSVTLMTLGFTTFASQEISSEVSSLNPYFYAKMKSNLEMLSTYYDTAVVAKLSH
ncbi:MAG: hypothetical protein NTX86_01590 [Candidatus Dependentiae bacterium]|nr:hypothetical protein [Candidatus Dependentiae bacterium]